jgi:hypothetical protein
MTINQIAQVVFDSFANTDIVLAVLNHNGSYVSNRLDVFEQVFAERTLLDGICRRVDDGQEPVLTQISGFLVAATGISSGLDGMGYAVMLLPARSFEGAFEHLDFIEIILEQFSIIGGLIEQNQQLRNPSESAKNTIDLASLATIN